MESGFASEQIRPQMPNDLFHHVGENTKGNRATRDGLLLSYMYLITVKFIPVPPNWGKVCGVYFDTYIPLIVKQSLDQVGKKLIVIPEASCLSLYIFAAAAVDITLFCKKNKKSLS